MEKVRILIAILLCIIRFRDIFWSARPGSMVTFFYVLYGKKIPGLKFVEYPATFFLKNLPHR